MTDYYIFDDTNFSSTNGDMCTKAFKVIPELEEIYYLKYRSWFYMELDTRFRVDPEYLILDKFKTYEQRLEEIKKRSIKLSQEEWDRYVQLGRI